jgi:magnesium-protoporphyrin IX monomethyl ester (oxidative) cyclase
MEAMRIANEGICAAKAEGGVTGWAKAQGWKLRAGLAFARMYMLPVDENRIPETSRLQPAY